VPGLNALSLPSTGEYGRATISSNCRVDRSSIGTHQRGEHRLVDPDDGAAYLLRHYAKIAAGLFDRHEIDRDVMRTGVDKHLSRISVIFGRAAVDENENRCCGRCRAPRPLTARRIRAPAHQFWRASRRCSTQAATRRIGKCSATRYTSQCCCHNRLIRKTFPLRLSHPVFRVEKLDGSKRWPMSSTLRTSLLACAPALCIQMARRSRVSQDTNATCFVVIPLRISKSR
jgi:hypothetical protein